MSEMYHPVIENVFETDGEDKGRIKNVEYAQILATAINGVYENHGALENADKKNLLDKQLDKKVRRDLTHVAVKSEHPTFESSKLDHWMAADGIGSSKSETRITGGSIEESEELQAMAETATEFTDQYDDLAKKAA